MKLLIFFIFIFSSFLHAEMIELKTQADFEEHLQSKGMSDSADKGIKRISPDKPAYKPLSKKKYKPKGMLIHFDFNSAAIRDYKILNEFAKALQNKLSNNIILISGHTDSMGSDEFNLKLSFQRAQAVKNF